MELLLSYFRAGLENNGSVAGQYPNLLKQKGSEKTLSRLFLILTFILKKTRLRLFLILLAV